MSKEGLSNFRIKQALDPETDPHHLLKRPPINKADEVEIYKKQKDRIRRWFNISGSGLNGELVKAAQEFSDFVEENEGRSLDNQSFPQLAEFKKEFDKKTGREYDIYTEKLLRIIWELLREKTEGR